MAYTDRSPVPVAGRHPRRYRRDDVLDAVHFGRAGAITPGRPHHYRLTGPHPLVEYDNTQRGDDHAHSVRRDAEGGFDLDPLANHRRAAGHP